MPGTHAVPIRTSEGLGFANSVDRRTLEHFLHVQPPFLETLARFSDKFDFASYALIATNVAAP